MAFVKMKNALGQNIDVPRGAVKAYQGLGYNVVDKEAEVQSTEQSTDDEGEKEPELSEDELFVKELEEKPLAQWNKDEVKSYAAIRNVDISGTKNAQEAKERIKAFMDASAE